MTPTMQTLPIDDVPCFCPTWDEIKSKAHAYKTARLRSTGQYVALLGYTRLLDGVELPEPAFVIDNRADETLPLTAYTSELCCFCL